MHKKILSIVSLSLACCLFFSIFTVASDAIVNPTENDFTHSAITNIALLASRSGEWIESSDGKWWYRYSDGSYPSNGWDKIDGEWYYFDSDGWMETGWLYTDGNWYYLGSDGAMRKGWYTVDGKTYFSQPTGEMVTGRKIINDKYQCFASSGAWQYRYIPNYSCKNAINYADDWALSRNENYITESSDCTNFVSQCLHAGGMEYDSKWFQKEYFKHSAPFINAQELHDYLVDERLAVHLSSWAIDSGSYFGTKVWKYTNNSNQLTSSNAGKVILFYDWNKYNYAHINHAAIFVKDNGTSTVPAETVGHMTADLIDQHTEDRKHVFWFPYYRSSGYKTSVMYAYEIRTS